MYYCQFCEAVIKRKSNFDKHICKERKYECSSCLKRFTTAYALERHKENNKCEPLTEEEKFTLKKLKINENIRMKQDKIIELEKKMEETENLSMKLSLEVEKLKKALEIKDLLINLLKIENNEKNFHNREALPVKLCSICETK